MRPSDDANVGLWHPNPIGGAESFQEAAKFSDSAQKVLKRATAKKFMAEDCSRQVLELSIYLSFA